MYDLLMGTRHQNVKTKITNEPFPFITAIINYNEYQ